MDGWMDGWMDGSVGWMMSNEVTLVFASQQLLVGTDISVCSNSISGVNYC